MKVFKSGDEVIIKSSGLRVKVVQVGKHGLVRVESQKLKAFSRDIYYPEELEVIA